jgi:hypothetical protein
MHPTAQFLFKGAYDISKSMSMQRWLSALLTWDAALRANADF